MKYKIWNTVWKGDEIPSQNRVLILGESHYGDESGEDGGIGKEVPYETRGVVRDYLDGNWYMFFNRIAVSFGYSRSTALDLYKKVYYANYVPVLCGKGAKNKADYFISGNRQDYNNDLFEFVNDNNISTIVCFSRRVFKALPSGGEGDNCEEEIIGRIGKNNKANIVRTWHYKENEQHGCCTILLNKGLTVYGLSHPSSPGGYSSIQAYSFFAKGSDLREVVN